jgi:hypothetical protein
MSKCATALFVAAVLIGSIPAASYAQLSPYSQSFGGLVATDPGALAADGWLVFANVFAADGTSYIYGYGPFPAPNSGPPYAFCTIATGEGGPAQGAQQLVVFSDYNNGDHGSGRVIESNVFQEQHVGGGDVGITWTFQFDAKRGDLAGASTALAFIKTLDPAAGYALTNFITVDMTTIPAAWSMHALSIMIDPTLVGQILQIGFLNKATYYQPSGIFYDNINFAPNGVIPTDGASWGSVKALFD